jgi:hypothetical protein
MHPSSTYQAILEEGEQNATRENLFAVGEELFGPPAESFRTQVYAITDLARLKRMVRRAAKAASWQEVLDTP